MITSEDPNPPAPHMLEGCDPDECYKTMMTERTDLIKARREAEDNLVKTVIQLSATLIALIAGFITQTSVIVSPPFYPALIAALCLLLLALTSGLLEHRFSSKAYLAQQQLVEAFYTRQINDFLEPAANKWVRRSQASSFICFVLGLSILGGFAILQAGEKIHDKSKVAASANPTTFSAPATTRISRGQLCERSKVGCSIDASPATQETVSIAETPMLTR